MTKVSVAIVQQRLIGNVMNIVADVNNNGLVTRKVYTVDPSLNNTEIVQYISTKLKEEKSNEKKTSTIAQFEVDL